MSDENKICPGCQQELPLSAFGRDSSRKDGIRKSCRTCDSSSRQARRSKNQVSATEVSAMEMSATEVSATETSSTVSALDHAEAKAWLKKASSRFRGQDYRIGMLLAVLAESPEIGSETIKVLKKLGFLAAAETSKINLGDPEDLPSGDGGASVALALDQLRWLPLANPWV